MIDLTEQYRMYLVAAGYPPNLEITQKEEENGDICITVACKMNLICEKPIRTLVRTNVE